jgi:hypothetical protein
MRVQVDEARDQDVSRELGAPSGRIALPRRADGEKLADTPVHYHDGVIREDRLRRIDRDDPAGFDNCGNGLGQEFLRK